MGNFMRWSAVFALIVLTLVSPSLASADSSFQIVALSPIAGPVFITPFDTSKGELTSVEVLINGTVTADFLTQVNLIPVENGPATTYVQVPVQFGVSENQSFGGGSQMPFSWDLPATFSFNGVGTGAGEEQQLVQSFSYSFRFDSATDFVGLAALNSNGPAILPGVAYGTTYGFTSPLLPELLEFVTLEPGIIPTYGGTLLDATQQGAIQIEYDYTPNPPQPTAPVSEPATLLLLGSGFVGLMARRRTVR